MRLAALQALPRVGEEEWRAAFLTELNGALEPPLVVEDTHLCLGEVSETMPLQTCVPYKPKRMTPKPSQSTTRC